MNLAELSVCKRGSARPARVRRARRRLRRRLDIYILPVLGNAWIGDLDLPDLNETVRNLTLHDGTPAPGGTKSTVAAVLRCPFAWARENALSPPTPR